MLKIILLSIYYSILQDTLIKWTEQYLNFATFRFILKKLSLNCYLSWSFSARFQQCRTEIIVAPLSVTPSTCVRFNVAARADCFLRVNGFMRNRPCTRHVATQDTWVQHTPTSRIRRRYLADKGERGNDLPWFALPRTFVRSTPIWLICSLRKTF